MKKESGLTFSFSANSWNNILFSVSSSRDAFIEDGALVTKIVEGPSKTIGVTRIKLSVPKPHNYTL